jgi:uncharacterized protein
MLGKSSKLAFVFMLFGSFSQFAHAQSNNEAHDNKKISISFVEMQSIDLLKQPPSLLTIKGKLQLPASSNPQQNHFTPANKAPAVVILHGSSGIDSRGDFYAHALNAVGIATLEIDMWEARGVTGAGDRPPLPIWDFRGAESSRWPRRKSFMQSNLDKDAGLQRMWPIILFAMGTIIPPSHL